MAQATQDELGIHQASSAISVPGTTGGRLHFHWGVGNEIFCCGRQMNKSSLRGQNHHENESVPSSSCIRWGSQGPAQRRVAYDACAKYLEYASQCNSYNASRKCVSTRDFVDGQISTLALDFAQSISDILGSTSLSSIDESDDVLQVIEEKALWDLLCAFVFDSAKLSPVQSTIPDISGWYHGNATAMCGAPSDAPWSNETIQYLQEMDIPELEHVYWSTFLRLVALGWISDALDVLGLHSSWLQRDSSSSGETTPADITILENMSSLLRRFPSLNDRSSSETNLTRRFDNLSDLLDYRKSWLQQCQELQSDLGLWEACAETNPETKDGCLACLHILLGDDKSIDSSVDSWCELFIAEMTHRYPDLTSLSEMKQIVLNVKSKRAPETEFHDAVASVIEYSCDLDHQAIIRTCSHLVSDWFLCHIPLILELSPAGPGPLHNPLSHFGADQSEFFRLDYACSLAPSSLTWQLALRYTGFCQHHGKDAFESICSMLPLCSTGSLARRAMNLAQEYGLETLCNRIQKQQGAVCWQNGLYGLAAYWYSLAGDMNTMDICLGGLINPESIVLDADTEGRRISNLEQCLDSLHLSANAYPGSNYAVLVTRICAHKKSKRSFERVTYLLRNIDGHLRTYCMNLLISSIPEIKPGFLEKEELVLLLDYVNLMSVSNPLGSVLTCQKRLIQLIALLDIQGVS